MARQTLLIEISGKAATLALAKARQAANTIGLALWLAMALGGFPAAGEAATPEQEAERLFTQGTDAMNAGKLSSAIADFENLERRFGKSKNQAVRGFVAGGLANRGAAERRQGKLQAALKSWQRACQGYKQDPSDLARSAISYALVQTGLEKKKLGDTDGALAAFLGAAEFVHPGDPQEMQDRQTGALADAASILRDQGKQLDALLAYEKIYRLSKDNPNPTSQYRAAYSLWQEGRLSNDLQDPKAALDAWRRVVQEFGGAKKESAAPQTKYVIAFALADQGKLLAGDLGDMNIDSLAEKDVFPNETPPEDSKGIFGNLQLNYSFGSNAEKKQVPQPSEALALFDEALSRFQPGDAQGISSPLSRAMLLKGQLYRTQGKPSQALEVFSALIQHFLHDSDSEAQRNVANAFVDKGGTLATLGRFQEALQAFDAAIGQAKGLSEDSARTTRQFANLGKVSVFLKDGKNEAALAICNAFIQGQEKGASSPAFFGVFAWQIKAWTLERMGKFPEAKACYDEAFNRFGTLGSDKTMNFMGQFIIMLAKTGALERHDGLAAALKAKADFSDYAKKAYDDAKASSSDNRDMLGAIAMLIHLSALPEAVEKKVLTPQQALATWDWETRRWRPMGFPEFWLPGLQTKASIQDKSNDQGAMLKTLDEIIKNFPGDAGQNAQIAFGWALGRKAEILRQQGDTAGARQLCEEILQRFEGSEDANLASLANGAKRLLAEIGQGK
jgi:tetratricopeptide (TPR) repeat protein